MIEGLQPHAEYKESGLPWLGRYPTHWVTKRGKSYMTCIDQRSKAGKEELLTVSSARGVVPRNSAKVTMFKAESYAGYKLCWPGDLVINSLWAWGGGLGVSQHHGIISTAYSVYRSRPSAHINPRFLHELVRSKPFNWELHVRSKGIWISRLQLTDVSFLDAPILLPPPHEQAAIVRFLDHANRKIDGFIRAKRKLIALLGEQKQAIIHRAVTRGLDPDAPLKPSGIFWLGDIPKHWDNLELRQIGSGFTNGTSAQQLFEGESAFPVSRIESISSGEINFTRVGYIKALGLKSRFWLKRNDILLSHINSFEVVGNCAMYDSEKPLIHGMNLLRITPKLNVLPRYLLTFLKTPAFRDQIRRVAKPAINQVSVTTQSLKGLRFIKPPLPEQANILDWCQTTTTPLVNAIVRTEREIALMQEYRTRLTADVVTGKLDVRETVTQLPDVAREPEPPFLENINEADEIEDTV